MITRSIPPLLLVVPLVLWLTACSTAARSTSPAPVVDHSAAPPTPATAESVPPVPPVQVQPLPRPRPLEPEPSVSMESPSPRPKPLKPKTPPLPEQTPQTPTATASVEPAEPVAPPSQPAAPAREVPTPPAEITPKGNQAVVALLDNARKYASAKDYDKAAAALERAIRIEPKNAGIWRDLALMRLYQGQYKHAEELANKAKSLAGSDEFVRSRSQEVIAAAQAKAAETPTQTSK